MTHQNTRTFEDKLALIRNISELNNLRIAGKLTDLTIELLKSDRLRNACLDYIKATFEVTVSREFFIQLPSDVVLSLLRANDLHVDGEETVFKSIGRWISPLGKVDERRLRHAEAMMKEVRWYELPNLKRIRERAASVALPDGRLFVIGGVDSGLSFLRGYSGSSVETCHLQEPADWQGELEVSNVFWKDVAAILEPRKDHTAVAFRDSIFLAGGSNLEGYLNTIDVFIPPDNQRPFGQWTRLAGWDTGRPTAALLVCEERLFSFSKSIALVSYHFYRARRTTVLFAERGMNRSCSFSVVFPH
ncbi:unnamed protein product [Dibothriocephalus latus]|uniref:BACK domain-containing protein n=1 Tax=Dibothriocephalus latus TaxID=60516 RepID=A0A3P7LSM1_DIBLA|nr:unnamed protein product [Dibothriocephalus latus]